MKSAVEDSQSTNATPISGRKRLKMFGEERDGSIASSGRVGDESSKKKQKIAVDYSDPFAIPDFPGGFDCGKYGSVTKDIEDLLARMKFLKPDFAIHYMSVGEEKNQSENEPRLPSQQVSLLPHHAVIVLDDDPITKDVAAALPVVIIDSDDEDNEVPRPSNLLQEVVTAKPNGEHHISDLLVKDGLDSSWSTKEEGALASETEVREGKDFYVAESKCLKKEEGPLSSATEVGEEKGFCVVESNCPRKEEGFLSDEMEVREEKYVADSNYSTKVEGALACKSEVKEEEGLNVVKSNCPKVEEVPLAGETGVREEKVYFADSNCPTKAEGPLASETKIREQKGFFITEKEEGAVASETEVREVKGYYVGVQDDEATEEAYYQTNIRDDGLGDIWKEMTIALECSKDIVEDPSSDEYISESGGDCDHSFVLKDDLGYVCRVCGVIDRGIETIFDFQYSKTKTTRTYKSESRNRESTEVFADGMKLSEHEFIATKISAHTWHRKEMKPHQVEGFNFLARNLAADNPGGCILAHAPGSGKTFMVLSFLQSFLEKYPHARPLVVLPKGIMANWKKEFQIWKVEDIPLFDLYTAKGDNRSQQLCVLKQWVEQKSILFVGYQQFSSIICSCEESQVLAACQKILLEVPSILILDEGHTPRNDETDVLNSLAKVQTPCKVVLSGTLYQNHVQEVFNILNLVRPRFLRSDTSRVIKKRIMSRVQISGVRKHVKSNEELAFYDLVEHTLQKDEDLQRKIHVIQDLREMTSKVLHYYKGDFSDELLGLEDFTVLLNLSAKQKPEVEKLKRLLMFKRNSVGSAVFLHPQLRYFSAAAGEKPLLDEKMDEILRKIDVRDGVKAKFFLNLLNLCESADEKLLVFSQYLPPLKFMERLAMKVKGWSPGKETFMISGDSNSELRECSMDQFNTSSDAKVFFGSIKACGEGISLVGASRILILDVHLNPSVTRQAIGRAFRRGQKRKVYTYRLVAADSHEEEDHVTSVKKESISKMWFEWDELSRDGVFELKTVDVNDSGDPFLESPLLREDIKVLYKR